ncbi:MAG: hypothetical protein Fur0043_04400 [Anaerolineales bacterium]
MAERVINAQNGRYVVPGRGKHAARKVEIDLGHNDPRKFVVVEKDLPPGLPTHKEGDPNFRYEWFACFGIRHASASGRHGDFANIPYTIYLDPLPAGKRLFTFYDGQVHELATQKAGNKIKALLNVGDPPTGFGP